MSIAGPYVYYACKINAYIHENKPEGKQFPHISDYWRVLVGMVIVVIAKESFIVAVAPLFSAISKHPDSNKVKK